MKEQEAEWPKGRRRDSKWEQRERRIEEPVWGRPQRAVRAKQCAISSYLTPNAELLKGSTQGGTGVSLHFEGRLLQGCGGPAEESEM